MAKKANGGNGTDAMVLLRKEAEKMIMNSNMHNNPMLAGMDMNALLQNIQVQQVELEMQNDELKLSNLELETQRTKFAQLFDLAPVGYFILNHYGIIDEVNTIALQLLSISKKTIIGKRFQSFIAENETEMFASFLYTLRYANRKHSCQLTMRTYGGDTFYAQVEGVATHSIAIESARCYIAVIDITERTNAALKLRDINGRLNMALSASSAGTWEINLMNGSIFLDDYSKGLFGFDDGDFDGRPDSFLFSIHAEDRKMAERNLLATLNDNKELDMEFRVCHKDGKVCYVAARGHIVFGTEGAKNFVGILIDIDQKKQFEFEAAQLKQYQEKKITAATLQAQENERKRISEALHDSVSQLLYGIKLNLGNQKNGDESSKKVNELLEMAINETRNISFELAPAILTDFGLTTAIEEMCKRLSSQHLNCKTFIYGLKERLQPETEISIFRIVQELVNNSIKHGEADSIRINIQKKGGSIYIEVGDNGKGFEFNEDTVMLKGSGLASIKNRLTLFNGSLSILSDPGYGTKVLVTIN